MESGVPERLVGCLIHGFRTMEELDIENIMKEANERWLRPNEIHAILCNYKYFTVKVKPVNLPKSGTIVLFDRKMLRNFRKDGHNWKKKKDGKTVKEAHEHLKVGNEERIHVYYAHGLDNQTFVRRCYWLLDKMLEHIVLVHYRETQELQGSPVTPVNSTPSPAPSDPSSTSWLFSDESDPCVSQAYHTGKESHLEHHDTTRIKYYERQLLEINTLEWDELLVPDDSNKLTASDEGNISGSELLNSDELNGYRSNAPSSIGSSLQGNPLMGNGLPASMCFPGVGDHMNSSMEAKDSELVTGGTGDSLDYLVKDNLQTQDSFGRWMNYIMTDSPETVDDVAPESTISNKESYPSQAINNKLPSISEQIFCITDVSPAWAFSTEETKILVTGFFRGENLNIAKSRLFCVCGDGCVPVEQVQFGVFRCLVSPHTPGLVNLYLSFDGEKPISQVTMFEYRTPLTNNTVMYLEDISNWDEFQVQMRLYHLLFSTSGHFNSLSAKVAPNALKEAKIFAHRTSHIADGWANLSQLIEENKLSFPQAKDKLLELALKNRLLEWLLERLFEGCKNPERDEQGQGVIHLCAILGYTWAVYPFSWSGLSLDYRDKFGWTALHWAALHGREVMVATLLSAGAKPNLVTDPTSEYPGGCTAADLASNSGHEGLAAYLAEKALVRHFEEMIIAGNVSGSLQPSASDSVNPGNFSEEELYLKDTLAAYRTAADAAARIQTAFREHSLKVRTKEILVSNPEDEASSIIAALKIQHAFRNYEVRKKMSAAARIQYRFRTWKIRKEFLNLRRQAIKIQAVFRGFQVRKQYSKIVWSVGVLEKAILRWRLKRKGFRGLKVNSCEIIKDEKQDGEVEEEFFRASRKQAEERIERSVVRVQAMFRSKRAQEDYRRMKLAYNTATLEYEGLLSPDTDMG